MNHLSFQKSRSVSDSSFNPNTLAHSLTHISFPIPYLDNTWHLDDTWLVFAFVERMLNVFTVSTYKTAFYILSRTHYET